MEGCFRQNEKGEPDFSDSPYLAVLRNLRALATKFLVHQRNVLRALTSPDLLCITVVRIAAALQQLIDRSWTAVERQQRQLLVTVVFVFQITQVLKANLQIG